MPDRLSIPEIPWSDADTWRAANSFLAGRVRVQATCNDAAIRIAGDIRQAMAAVSPLLERLCRATCPWCPEPCCLSANVWYDFSDLLFLHWSGAAIPLAQPRTRRGEICWFLGARGCRLPREIRPWLCTWYICPTQMAWWRKVAPAELAMFDRLARFIRAHRRSLEMVFVDGERPCAPLPISPV
ncbi:MAG: hypothetical protein SWH68_16900 [Thermodesulfobacteriota bacterium]|nr:hypothetical protein [Thermodesulfobacteriota bacterium]